MASYRVVQSFWYRLVQLLARCGMVLLFRVRVYGREHIPPAGPVLLLSNHQSHLDPIVLGMATSRPVNFLARRSLFDFPPLAWLLRSLGGIPLDRDGKGAAGIKQTMRLLKKGHMVGIFPEGTRTSDGEIAPLKPGFTALAKRCHVTLLPAAIEGAWQAWPRDQRLPRTGRICLVFGQAFTPEEVAADDEEELARLVEGRLRECHARARELRTAMIRED